MVKKPDYAYSTINDAVHGVMTFPRDLKDLILGIVDSSNFQRLRHIKQLGMVDLVFPTATHTRFSHSLGTAYIASKMSETLQNSKKDNDIRNYAIIGSLLHDIGHGPFSHAFESLLKKEEDEENKYNINHEDWTEPFLEKFYSDGTFKDTCIDYKTLANLIKKEYELKDGKLNTAQDIISSQLDADRLDYLLRDAHFCGVPYGNVDIWWIVKHLTLIEKTKYPPKIGVFKKGMRAVEHYLLCRKFFYQNVCYHHNVKMLEHLLVSFLQKATQSEYMPDVEFGDFLKNVQNYRTSKIDKSKFITDNFEFYKKINDCDVWLLIRHFSELKNKNVDDAIDIADIIYNRKLHKHFYFKHTCVDGVKKTISELIKDHGMRDWEIFTTKKSIITYESQDNPILIKDENSMVFRIEEFSDMLKYTADKTENEGNLAISQDLWKERKDFLKKQFATYIHFPKD